MKKIKLFLRKSRESTHGKARGVENAIDFSLRGQKQKLPPPLSK